MVRGSSELATGILEVERRCTENQIGPVNKRLQLMNQRSKVSEPESEGGHVVT
jgi:hypothetical protein